ncbi:MAG: NADH-quinone oxidoreductase subunit A [Deinococcus sp.]|nr:NADH-quinone oxidoreductase subunit A [Deinococcus sp.]
MGVVIVAATLFLAKLLRPDHPYRQKLTVYECGEVSIGSTQVQFSVNYYMFALLFVVFDVETVFLYPWAVAFSRLGWLGVLEAAIFIVILLAGLLYAWRRGVLRWVY